MEHFTDYASVVADRFLGSDDLVVEIGCNDGLLLRQFDDDIRTIGIEPAKNVAEVAETEHGLNIRNSFFSADVALDIVDSHGTAAAVLANNVVGHLDDLHDLMLGIKTLIGDNGIFIMEVPYLVDLIHDVTFDTIYHEHLSYFAVRPLQQLANQFDMEVFDVDRIDTQGGSIRLYLQPETGPYPKCRYVDDLMILERAMGLNDSDTFDAFANNVEFFRVQLRSILTDIRDIGGKIVGYGAPAKGNVLLNYCNLGGEMIEFLVDTTPAKQQRFAPGTGIPVHPPERFNEELPDYALLLAWNYADTILKNEHEFRGQGGRFIIPQPSVDLV
ncbi:class I SAM-dependent methyltransferase [Haloarcula halophila]|uniref:class I SAM-dependent methyltransferase n=1 Tax=Haloarcula TaxID=2237 RepID=UPI0023E46629|nr:class I SAM-dependent methyltransferase [Halomicroarcula sp. DFY41]